MRSFFRLIVLIAALTYAASPTRAQPAPPPPDDTAGADQPSDPPADPPAPESYQPAEPTPEPAPPTPPPPAAPGAPAGYASPPAEPAPPPPTTVDKGVIDDANSGRAWLGPTALTPPKGSWSFSDWELFWVGASYAFTDSLQVSASTMVPITSDQPFILLMTGKWQVFKQGRMRVALHGAINHISGTGDDDEDFNGFNVGAFGGAATLCLDNDCHSYLNGYLAAGFLLESDVDQTSVPFILAGSLVKRLSRRVKLVLEVDSSFVTGEVDDMSEVFLGWYGLRFTSSHIGVDFGFARPFGPDVDWDVFPMGFPILNFTYRGLPGD